MLVDLPGRNLQEVYRRENKLPEDLKHYMENGDRNLVIYHSKSDETEDKITRILREAKFLQEHCNGDYDESSNYQLLIRVLQEQTIEENGAYQCGQLKQVGSRE